ncbi:class I SAM-dependent methyltransferase [Taklimakanibacter lacteus]|uniref:class I SAM-dependent methyltransferase n=1 Tax=Taklimakanibacter lacteus TaxID=2268456 RepID=UPI000E6766D6
MSDPPPASSAADERNFDAELEYTYGFFPFLKADSLMLNALLAGVRPPGAQGSITYCELGCGQGLTLSILAAGDESGRYVGIDYNPAQITNASALAREAGLDNVEFIEESFANLQARDLPDFDIVVLHGIYSWISPKLRHDIVEFLNRKLKPAGLCFVSYNCAIGRASDLAFRQLLQAALRREGTPSPGAIAKSLAVADAFAEKGARYFAQNTATLDRLKDARTRDPVYVFHEYFNPVWTPFFFHEVAAEMAEAQLTYVGSTSVAWNYPDLAVPGNLRAIFESFPAPADQELLKGIWANQPFRRDLYVKGARSVMSPDEQIASLQALHFGLSRPRADCPLKVNVPAGVANLPDKPFIPLLDALEKSPVSGAELRRHLPPGAVGDQDFVRALIILLGAEYLELRTAPGQLATVRRRFDRVNATIARATDRSQDIFVVATPKNRLAIRMNPMSYYLYRAHQTGPDNRVGKAYRLLEESGRSVQYKGRPAPDRKTAEAVLAEQESVFVSNTLPRL